VTIPAAMDDDGLRLFSTKSDEKGGKWRRQRVEKGTSVDAMQLEGKGQTESIRKGQSSCTVCEK